MQSAPPVLTPERIDAMLSRTAEVCMEAIDESEVRLKAAADEEAFERCGRTLSTACRNLRQTIAMKQRFDREQAGLAAERRRQAEDEREAAEGASRAAVIERRYRVLRHFERLLWNEYESDDAQETFDELDGRLAELSEADDFVATPIETLIARLTEEFELRTAGETTDVPASHSAEEAAPPPGDSTAEIAEVRRDACEAPTAPRVSAISAVQDDLSPEPEPPPRPPDPPYLPPWERNPHASIRGGSGW